MNHGAGGGPGPASETTLLLLSVPFSSTRVLLNLLYTLSPYLCCIKPSPPLFFTPLSSVPPPRTNLRGSALFTVCRPWQCSGAFTAAFIPLDLCLSATAVYHGASRRLRRQVTLFFFFFSAFPQEGDAVHLPPFVSLCFILIEARTSTSQASFISTLNQK